MSTGGERALGSLLGALVGAAISSVTEVTRQGIASALRDAAHDIERGNLVSDREIDALRDATDRIRGLQGRSRGGTS